MKDTNLTILQGATYTTTITYGNPVQDISAYTIARLSVATGYKNTAGRSVLFTLSQADGIDLTNASTGVVTFTLSATRTGLMVDEIYYYDLELEDPSGNVMRLIYGRMHVKPEVTD